MQTRSIEILPDHFYHIYNRGNNKQRIFRSARDYDFFLGRMTKYFKKAPLNIIAFCLMPNHFHLLIQILEEMNFAKIMKSFSISYVKSFHLWHKTTGHLFEDDYQAKPVDVDRHLVQIIPYFHLNPVLAGIVQEPEDWAYSDCQRWCFERESFPFNDLREQLYGSPGDYREYLQEYRMDKKEIQELERILFRGE